MKQLDPKALWLFFLTFSLQGIFVLIGLTAAMFAFFIELSSVSTPTATYVYFLPIMVLKNGILILIAYLLFTFLWARLSYKYYRYELREDGFRKESGVIWKQYVTIPYERIQNVDIYRGIIARLLGISDLHIQTAGSSTPYARSLSEGRLPGLSRQEAERLRDELVKHARGKNHGV